MNTARMQQYIGTKIIFAKPMFLGEYNNYRGWELPDNEDGAAEGYLVEYDNTGNDGKRNHPDHEGYISWSPKKVFENSYKFTNGMSFGLAIEAMIKGCHVFRKGWNGKGIFIGITYPSSYDYMSDPYLYIDTTSLKTNNPDAPKCRIPWLASQTDMLANDYEVI